MNTKRATTLICEISEITSHLLHCWYFPLCNASERTKKKLTANKFICNIYSMEWIGSYIIKFDCLLLSQVVIKIVFLLRFIDRLLWIMRKFSDFYCWEKAIILLWPTKFMIHLDIFYIFYTRVYFILYIVHLNIVASVEIYTYSDSHYIHLDFNNIWQASLFGNITIY